MASAVQAVQAPEVGEEAEVKLPVRQRTFWFGILWLIYWFDMVDRMAINAVFPAIKQEYNLSDAQLGFVSGIIGFTVCVVGVPAAWLVDKWSRKYMIAIMVAFWSAATWLSGAATSYTQLLAARLGVGAGEAAYNPAAYSLITAWFPKSRRGTMMGIFNMAQPLGAFVGVGLAGWIAVNYGWRHVFGLLAIPGFFLAVLMIWCPDYKTKKVSAQDMRSCPAEQVPAARGAEGTKVFTSEEAKAGFWATLRYVTKSPTILLMYFYMPVMTLWALGGFGTWAPTYFGRTFKLDMGQAGMTVMFVGLFAAVGPFLGGLLSDYLVKRNVAGRMWAAIFLLIVSVSGFAASILYAMNGGELFPVAALWACGHICIAAHWGTSYTAIMELVPPPMRGLSWSIQQAINLPVYMFAAVITGLLSDAYGLLTALLVLLLVGVIPSILFFFAATKTYQRDVDRLKAQGTFELSTK